MRVFVLIAAGLLTGAAAPPKPPATPSEVIAAAPAAAWRTIPADDLLLMDLKGRGRVVIQLAPEFAPVHVANIKSLARSDYWNGAAVYRVQDNYVAQWGINEVVKPLPSGVVKLPPHEYWRSAKGLTVRPLGYRDSYAPAAGYARGWPVAYNPKLGRVNLTHCYGYVGVARDLAPDTGTGGELYAIIGHAPRQLDRNIAVVGRVIEGIEHLSSLPRGTEALGIYKERSEDAPIEGVRLASQFPAAEQPVFQYLDPQSASFATYLRLRANRNDPFYQVAAGGVDLCNAPVPVRRKPS